MIYFGTYDFILKNKLPEGGNFCAFFLIFARYHLKIVCLEKNLVSIVNRVNLASDQEGCMRAEASFACCVLAET